MNAKQRFFGSTKKVRPSHVDLSCESEPDFGGHNNNRKQRANRAAQKPEAQSFVVSSQADQKRPFQLD